MSAIFFGMTISRTRKTVSPSAVEAAGYRSVADDAVRERFFALRPRGEATALRGYRER